MGSDTPNPHQQVPWAMSPQLPHCSCGTGMSQRLSRKPREGKFCPRPSNGRAGQVLFALPGNGGAGGSPGDIPTLELDPSGGDGVMTPGMGQGPQFQLGFLSLPCSGGSSRPLFPPGANPGKGVWELGGSGPSGRAITGSPPGHDQWAKGSPVNKLLLGQIDSAPGSCVRPAIPVCLSQG